MLIAVFFLGWTSSMLVGVLANDAQPSMPNGNTFGEKDSPSDWIDESSIHVYSDKVVIDIDNPKWAKFTDTNSMDPFIDEGSNAIEIVPESPLQIQLGDVVAYESDKFDGVVIHRVVEKGYDDKGVYFILKGDNNMNVDPGKVRFNQIKRVLVAVIY